jgi:uncharacterized membrane protein (UPF0127 family)
MEKIALLPGGFKPPHAGHYNMAIWLAENTDADTVIIKIGAKERDGITREISLKLWNLYRNNDTNESSRKLTILPSDSNSPVQDVYDFIENKAPNGSIIYLGMGEKDINDSRFNNIPKFADPKNIKFETTLVPPQAGGVSGTKMRDFIKTGDKTSFQNFIPSFLSKEQKDQAWELVSSLSEDFYDPRNKFYDFAKSNDPGPKDDIEPSYKYKRGGIYGRMYEVEQEVEELMMGMMTEPEKKKHAKNLKRLKKDTAKQGDQYMEVPDYLKGTLTRKLYEEEDLSHYATSAASVNDITIPLEIMDTPEKQITGMMDRDELKGGMVFPYNQVSKKNFHMEGCKIPLDIIFINQGKIDKIHHSCPPCKQTPCPQYSGLADNVIELEGGYCKKHGIKEGDEVNLNLIHQDNKVKYTLKEKLDKKDIKQIDTFADKQLDPVDVDLTSDHFFNRLNDPRNDKEISNAELIGFFKRLAKKKKDLLDFLSKYKEIVASDSRTDINIPFLKQADKIIAKTILRKKDFQTSNPQLSLERDLSAEEERIAKSLPDKEFKKRYGKDWKSVKIATATKMAKKNENYPPYKADQVQKVRYQASDTFTNSPKDAKKKGYLEGDTYEKMAAKGKKKGNLKQGTVRKRLKIKDGEKIPLSKITKAISKIKKMKNPSEKNKKYLKALNLAKTLKTTTHKENINEADPKKGTGKKPKGSGRRLYTDENPKDTVKVKFSTRQDIVDTLNKKSFKSKSHARQSQVINLIHQRVRAALNRAKDPDVKKRLRTAFDYIKKRKEASKKKTQRMKKENAFTKNWWKEVINEVLLTEGGAAGHMAHPFNLPNVNNGKQLLDVFEKSADSLDKNPGAVKIDGVNSSIRLIDVDGKKQFVMDRGSKKPLDLKGITKDDLLDRFGKGHGMVKIGGEVLDMFNEALPSLEADLKKLGAWEDPNILFNMEYVSGKTNVQDYGANFIAIHGLNKIESKEVQGKRGPLTKRISSEVSYSKSDLQSLLDNLTPVAKKKDFEVYGSVPANMTKKPNFNAALSKRYTVEAGENTQAKSLGEWLNTLSNIPEEEFIFMNVDYEKDSSTVNRKKVGAVSKQVYLAILNGENVDGLFDDEKDREKAIQGFVTYLATEKLGDEVLKVLDSPMGSVENHEGVVIRDENIANVPFKITGKFILGGLVSDF